MNKSRRRILSSGRSLVRSLATSRAAGSRLSFVTLFLLALPVSAQTVMQSLVYRPLTAKMSVSLDRIVMISANPDQLHIYDPKGGDDIAVALPKSPICLDVSPDGRYAVVGHDGLVSWVSLASASLIKTITISGTVNSITLGSTYAWVFLQGNGYTGGLAMLNLSSGTLNSGSGFLYYASSGVLNVAGTALYVSSDGESPNDMQEVDVSGGTLGNTKTWAYHGDYADCGPYWLSPDGNRIYEACGTVVHASANPALDMYYMRTLPVTAIPMAGLAESASLKRLAVISVGYPNLNPGTSYDTQVQLLTNDYFNPAGTLALLPFTTPAGTFPAHGHHVFFSSDSSRLYVVVQADSSSNLANSFAVEVLDMANPPLCSTTFNTPSVSVGSSGTLGSVGISASPDCIYTAVSDANWIQLTSGSYGSGNNSLEWIARPNQTSVPRSGTISIGSHTFTIDQAGAPSVAPSLARLSFNVTDAEYSISLGKLVLVSTSPNELHIYDPLTEADQIVPLVMPPFAVSVGPDGLHAAVGHDGWISYVDLQTASEQHFFQLSATCITCCWRGTVTSMVSHNARGRIFSL